MAEIEDHVMVYESTDGGSGDPRKTFWQFFVGPTAVSTDNPLHAETMRLAIETSSKVRVTFQEEAGKNVMSQARLAFQYVCNSRKIERCVPPEASDLPQEICETIRFAPCKPIEKRS